MAKAKLNSNKAVIVDAIQKQVEKGKGFAATLALLGKKWPISGTSYRRYWKIANENHAAAQLLIKEAKAKLDIESALNERKGQIADVLERKEILTKIARGQIPLQKAMIVDNVIEYIEIVPDWMDRKAAIAELNKMEGEYAPLKVAVTDTQGNDILVGYGKEEE